MPKGFRHGGYGSGTYQAWGNMLSRCRNKRRPDYHSYGGRGITVCERWHSFANFRQDMGDRPEGKTLDRIDNDGHYEPKNVRWASRTEQSRNTSRNRIFSIEGQSQCLKDWASEVGLNYETLRSRLAAGLTLEFALARKVGRWI